jgi:hypothetical protein
MVLPRDSVLAARGGPVTRAPACFELHKLFASGHFARHGSAAAHGALWVPPHAPALHAGNAQQSFLRVSKTRVLSKFVALSYLANTSDLSIDRAAPYNYNFALVTLEGGDSNTRCSNRCRKEEGLDHAG